MEKAWYHDLPDEDAIHREGVERIREAVGRSLGFEEAARLLEVENARLQEAILDDALKVLIAEMHFAGGTPLAELARRLKVPEEKLAKARAQMLEDVEEAAIRKYREEQESGGES